MITRDFDAPRSRVFDAWTKPEVLRHWFGPTGWSLVECEVDLKVGGAYREIVPPERFVHTERFELEDFPGELLVTTNLLEDRGRTTMTSTVRYPSQELRDGDVDPTEHGATQSYAKLDEYLASTA